MNIRKITTAVMITFMACTMRSGFSASAQDGFNETPAFDELKAAAITNEQAAEQAVPNLSAADSFGNLNFNLLAMSRKHFEELQKLIGKEASLSNVSETNTDGVRKYELTKKQVTELNEHLKPLVKGGQVETFHTFRIARRDADFLFGELPWT